ncbi:TonB-dependent receptor [Vibrio ostreae]|uniref:TonB-dependent receptor n=1 Tax=Vibrio ostreae TaxID=2841925 RepID=A0A975UCE9_9VIBR|nr:TonB-dependent receptor [Vibrio ostreae]
MFADDSSGYRTEQGDYALVDLMGRYDITRQTQVQVNINNVFDKKYYAGICTTCYSYGDPANVTVSLQHNF